MLVLGGGVHGGIEGRAHHCIKPSITSRGRIRGRWGESQVFFLRAPQAPPATQDRQNDEVAPAVATDCPARSRHGRILNCEDERRKDTPRSPLDDRDRERAWPRFERVEVGPDFVY